MNRFTYNSSEFEENIAKYTIQPPLNVPRPAPLAPVPSLGGGQLWILPGCAGSPHTTRLASGHGTEVAQMESMSVSDQ